MSTEGASETHPICPPMKTLFSFLLGPLQSQYLPVPSGSLFIAEDAQGAIHRGSRPVWAGMELCRRIPKLSSSLFCKDSDLRDPLHHLPCCHRGGSPFPTQPSSNKGPVLGTHTTQPCSGSTNSARAGRLCPLCQRKGKGCWKSQRGGQWWGSTGHHLPGLMRIWPLICVTRL